MDGYIRKSKRHVVILALSPAAAEPIVQYCKDNVIQYQIAYLTGASS